MAYVVMGCLEFEATQKWTTQGIIVFRLEVQKARGQDWGQQWQGKA